MHEERHPMNKILIVYWSGTGNTEQMADLVAEGASAAGAEVTKKTVADASPAEIADYDVLALGSPSMGAEVIEEQEMEPFVAAISAAIGGRKMGLFGSYDWGDGEWMRTWTERMSGDGAKVAGEGLIVHLTPEGDDTERCREYGKQLAGM